jgi:hypothetical protein
VVSVLGSCPVCSSTSSCCACQSECVIWSRFGASFASFAMPAMAGRTATNPTMIPRLASVVAPMKPDAVYACTVHPDGR